MVFAIPEAVSQDLERFKAFLATYLTPHLQRWYKGGSIPAAFFRQMGENAWFGLRWESGQLIKTTALKEALFQEELAKQSPGIAVAVLAHIHLGLTGLYLFGSDALKQTYGEAAANGHSLMCLGNTENMAGSDVAGMSMQARKVPGGWVLNGSKAYVTNGLIADKGIITAVSDPQAPRNRRLSMYLVDLNADGVRRR